MADHYKVLGLTKNASKPEIKDAFRKLAIQFHPDKHSQSSKSDRDAATRKFKQVSEAYEVLIDDRKRAAYNLSRYSNNGGSFYSRQNYNSSGYSYNSSYDANFYHRGGSYYRRPPPSSSSSSNFAANVDAVFRFMTTRAFLLNLAFAGILLGGTVAIDMSGEALWKMQNSGKNAPATTMLRNVAILFEEYEAIDYFNRLSPVSSIRCLHSNIKSFEEAMKSIEKNRGHEDDQ